MAQNTYTDDRKKANELLAKLSIPKMKNKTAITEQIVLVSIIGLAWHDSHSSTASYHMPDRRYGKCTGRSYF